MCCHNKFSEQIPVTSACMFQKSIESHDSFFSSTNKTPGVGSYDLYKENAGRDNTIKID